MAREKKELSFVDRMVLQAIGNEVQLGGEDASSLESYPKLMEWMTTTKAGNDHVKEPAKVTIVAVPGGFLATVSDGSLKLAIDASSPSLGGVWGALEAELCAPSPAFRKFGRGDVSVRKKRTQT